MYDEDDYDDYDNFDIDDDMDDVGVGGEQIDDCDIELAGSLDAELDNEDPEPISYGSYGLSVDFDELTDEQKDLYDDAYHASKS